MYSELTRKVIERKILISYINKYFSGDEEFKKFLIYNIYSDSIKIRFFLIKYHQFINYSL